jgi:cytochrome c biogenesis protein CcdA
MRAGDVSAAMLQLPRAFKRRIHRIIREGATARLIVPGALLAGAGVSALELACTGQVYVPAIIYMSSISETSGTAMAWLSVYCLCFVTPLLALLGFITLGASSKRIAVIASRQAASTKFYLAVFFVLCGLYFGIRAIGG